jgi:hypothetical protein
LTPEEAAVVAKEREKREKENTLYCLAGAGVIGVGVVVFWFLNAANKLTRQNSLAERRRQAMERWSRPDLFQ